MSRTETKESAEYVREKGGGQARVDDDDVTDAHQKPVEHGSKDVRVR